MFSWSSAERASSRFSDFQYEKEDRDPKLRRDSELFRLRNDDRLSDLEKRRTRSEDSMGRLNEIYPVISTLLSDLGSTNLETVTNSLISLRKVVSPEKFTAETYFFIEQFLKYNPLPLLVSFLNLTDKPLLQFEASWILSNFCDKTSEKIQICKVNAVPALIKNLASPSISVQIQSIWCLGNLSDGTDNTSEYFLEAHIEDVLPQFLSSVISTSLAFSSTPSSSQTVSSIPNSLVFMKSDTPEYLLEITLYALKEITMSSSVAQKLRTLRSALCSIMKSVNLKSMINIAIILKQIGKMDAELEQNLLNNGCIPSLNKLCSLRNSPEAVSAATRLISCLTSTDVEGIERTLINAGVLDSMKMAFSILSESRELKSERQYVMFALNNLSSGYDLDLENAIISSGLLCTAFNAFEEMDIVTASDALDFLKNFSLGSKAAQQYAITSGVHLALANRLDNEKPILLEKILKMLYRMLFLGQKEAKRRKKQLTSKKENMSELMSMSGVQQKMDEEGSKEMGYESTSTNKMEADCEDKGIESGMTKQNCDVSAMDEESGDEYDEEEIDLAVLSMNPVLLDLFESSAFDSIESLTSHKALEVREEAKSIKRDWIDPFMEWNSSNNSLDDELFERLCQHSEVFGAAMTPEQKEQMAALWQLEEERKKQAQAGTYGFYTPTSSQIPSSNLDSVESVIDFIKQTNQAWDSSQPSTFQEQDTPLPLSQHSSSQFPPLNQSPGLSCSSFTTALPPLSSAMPISSLINQQTIQLHQTKQSQESKLDDEFVGIPDDMLQRMYLYQDGSLVQASKLNSIAADSNIIHENKTTNMVNASSII